MLSANARFCNARKSFDEIRMLIRLSFVEVRILFDYDYGYFLARIACLIRVLK